jgi:hypothetical protein
MQTNADYQARRELDHIDLDFIVAQAQLLRPDHLCLKSVRDTRTYRLGWTNSHVPITFEDGTKWMARLRGHITRLGTRESEWLCIQSAATTFQNLHDRHLPVPAVRFPPAQHREPSRSAPALHC